ncbi:hypothetical protein JCM3774_002473 [Rhodotorula dairenensis]
MGSQHRYRRSSNAAAGEESLSSQDDFTSLSSSDPRGHSDSLDSADEEAQVGSTRPPGRKTWTMRSMNKGGGGTGRQGYGSTHQDDYSDYGSSPDEYGDSASSKPNRPSTGNGTDTDSDPYSAPKSKTKSTSKSKKGTSTGKEDGGEDQDDGSGNSKKWWWVGGIAAVIVLALILGGLYLWNRDEPGTVEGDAASTQTSRSIASDSATSLNSSDSTATSSLASIASSERVLTSTKESIASSQTPSHTSETPKPTPTASKTEPDPAPSTTYAAQITWFKAPKQVSECGTKASDKDYVVRISRELYGDPTSVSPLCGTWITMYQLEKDAMVRATIEGISSNMTGHNLDLSRQVFEALTSNLELGTTLAQWWLTEEKHRPAASLSSAVVPSDTAATSLIKAGSPGDGEDGTVTIATAPNPVETDAGKVPPNGLDLVPEV